jgi:hypothetical protein
MRARDTVLIAVFLWACSDDPAEQPCGPASCSGCCDQSGACVAPSATNCGLGGGACLMCNHGEQCVGGVCTAEQQQCGPVNCTGCCDLSGACVETSSTSACGTRGHDCAVCTTGQQCVGGACIGGGPCGSDTCPGCCDSSGACVQESTTASCGSQGEQCAACETGQECKNGQCSCTPSACNGCCEDNLCKQSCAASSYMVYLESVNIELAGEALCKTPGSQTITSTTQANVIPLTTATWTNELMLIASEQELTTLFHVEVWDEDFGPDVEMADCTPQVTTAELEAGTLTVDCDQLGVTTTIVTFSFKPQ